MKKDFFAGKNVLIMGLGRFGGGLDAAKFVAASDASVTVTDLSTAEKLTSSIDKLKEFENIKFHLGSHQMADFELADIVIVNPAVPSDNEFLGCARKLNKCVTSQIEIFFELCPARIIGITGSNGKSTTSALTAYILASVDSKKYGNVWLSGNIGNQPLLQLLKTITSADLVVLELSSFQLEQLANTKKAPAVALLTNLTPNHLDRHGSFEDYCQAKENIFRYQSLDEKKSAVSIFNSRDEIASVWFDKYEQELGRHCVKFSPEDFSDGIGESFALPGVANLANLAAAVVVVRYFGITDEQIIKALPAFRGLAYRLELVGEINGVKWYDDSIATTPESVIAALDAFSRPKILIAGGYDKGIDFAELGKCIGQKAKAVILIGKTAEKIAAAIICSDAIAIKFADSLEGAVALADKLARSGDVVLLSPACASYDMFDNFQDRGNQFKSLVKKLSR